MTRLGALTAGVFARSIAKTLLLHLLIALASGLLLFALVDAVEVGNLARKDAEASILRLTVFNLPSVAQQIAPFCVLLATLTTVSSHRRDVEAMMFAGASPLVLFLPAALVAVVVALFDAGLSEYLVPPAQAEVTQLRRELGLPSRVSEALSRTSSWMKSGDVFFRVEELADTEARELRGVVMLRVVDDRVLSRWDIGKLSFASGHWVATSALQRDFGDEQQLTTQRHEQIQLSLAERPKDFLRSVGSPHRQRFTELGDTIAARRRLGQPTRRHRLERARRIAEPALLVALLLLAVGCGLALGHRSSTATALATGAGLALGTWLLEEVGVALSATGAVAPELGAGLIFAVIALAAAVAAFRAFTRGIRQ